MRSLAAGFGLGGALRCLRLGWRARWLLVVVALAGGLAFAASASASAGDVVVANGYIWSNPSGVAVDASGDLFVADTTNDRVVRDVPNGYGGYNQSVVGGGQLNLNQPNGVAVDGAGDVFIADTFNHRVVKDTPDGSGGYTDSVVDQTGLAYPGGVAVDASGDLFIADTNHNRVVKDTPNGSGGYTQSVVDQTGLAHPSGVAVDASGHVFIADTNNGQLVEDTPNGSGGYTQSVLDNSLGYANAVALDGSGDVFIGDSGRSQVVKYSPNGSGGYAKSVVDNAVAEPYGVAVDGSGNVFVADRSTNNPDTTCGPSLHFSSCWRMVKDVPNGAGGYTQTFLASDISSPNGVAVDGSGDVFIADTLDNRVVEDVPNGTGGYTQSVVDSSVIEPCGVAVDGSGDVFIAGTVNTESGSSVGRVVKDVPNGSGGYTQSVVDQGGLAHPHAVAVDRAGDVFIADSGNNQVFKDVPNGSGGYTQSVVDSGVDGYGVAVDAAGNVLIADYGANLVVKEAPNGSGGYTRSVVDNRLGFPSGVAVDAAGDVFIADTDNGRIVEDVPDGSGGYTQSVVDQANLSYPGGLSTPGAVAVDASGDVFVADPGQIRVLDHVVPLAKVSVHVAPDSSGDGKYTVTATALSAAGKRILGYQDPAPAWSDADGELGAQQPAAFIAGRSVTTGVTLSTPTRADTVSVTTGGVTGTSPSFKVLGPLARFYIGVPSSVTAGTAFTVKVYAEDSAGNVLAGYHGSPAWSDTSGQLSVWRGAFSGGVSSNAVTIPSAHKQDKITVTDAAASVTSQSGAFTVLGPLAKFAIGVSSSQTAGTAFTVRVYAEDSAGNVLAGYHGSPSWSDSSGQISGSPAAFSGGVSTNAVTIPSAHKQDKITVTDAAASVTSQSGAFNVLGPLARFFISVPSSAKAGTAFTVKLYAGDSAGNLLTGYHGSPSWSDTSGQLSGSPAAFSGGVSTNQVTVAHAYSNDRVTVTSGSVTSRSAPFNIA